MAQQQVGRQKARIEKEPATQTEAAPVDQELAEKVDATLDSIDDVLDDQLDAELLAEIDDVLEENAEQFVASYIQEGGQ